MTLSNREVARRFAEGLSGRSKNMWIGKSGDIYSYTINFPIARRYKGHIYLFNSDSYSITTTRHKNLVLRELKDRRFTIIHVPDCDINNAFGEFQENEEKIIELKDKLTRVRSDTIKMCYERYIADFYEQNKLLEKVISNIVANKL